MDIALVLDKIRPGAAWRRSDNYETLKATWEDEKQTIPTEEEINLAWEAIQKEASEPQIITPTVDKEKADMWEAIFALSAQLEALKGGTV